MITEFVGPQVNRDDNELDEPARDDGRGPIQTGGVLGGLCSRIVESVVQVPLARDEGASYTVAVLRIPARPSGGP